MITELLKLMNKPHTLEELAAAEHSTPAAVKHWLSILERQGYVESIKPPRHGCSPDKSEERCAHCLERQHCQKDKLQMAEAVCPILMWRITSKGEAAAARGL